MKLFYLTVLVLGVGLVGGCKNNYGVNATNDKQALQDSANFTEIQWIDTAKNLDPVIEGKKIDIAFRFKNVGNKPLVIERVQPSCGCTVADPPKEPIQPGKEGVITGVFDSNGKMGPNHKTLHVYANTRPSTEHVLVFNVVVTKKDN